jgi:8-oxo-dGTP pyrophosphatase MutT (NUDIX family)
MQWHPHVTVAAVAERDGRFLCVQETVDGRSVINQPAGHLEPGESLVDAVVRETLEETGWTFAPLGLVGLYRWRVSPDGATYLRLTFHGELVAHDPTRALDTGIDSVLWLSHTQLARAGSRLRSPLVLRSLADYLAGRRYPLSLLQEL